jgi:hypothetical protein
VTRKYQFYVYKWASWRFYHFFLLRLSRVYS